MANPLIDKAGLLVANKESGRIGAAKVPDGNENAAAGSGPGGVYVERCLSRNF